MPPLFDRNSYYIYILRFHLYNNKRSAIYIYIKVLFTPRYGNGISTKCLIYNATGATLDFITYKDWQGHIFETPHPSQIQNGQWGAFLHVHPKAAARGSAGAAVYRTKRPSGSDSCDWLFCWSIPYIGDNSVSAYRKI